jgi:tRNA threonylcarbamoyladenosine biosynthesis protein TsaB
VILLAIDTCDPRGSVALLGDDIVLGWQQHDTDEEYSSWLLPAVDRALKQSGCTMREVDAYGVAAGPGSFTGVRAGLTTVKAWGEVYGKPIAAVSRLEAIACHAQVGTNFVASFLDARRGEVFGAVYRRGNERERVGDEMVMGPGNFVLAAAELARGERIAWAGADVDSVVNTEEWRARAKYQEALNPVSPYLGIEIARCGKYKLSMGRATDPLALDANYVRRSDAEFSRKGGGNRGG